MEEQEQPPTCLPGLKVSRGKMASVEAHVCPCIPGHTHTLGMNPSSHAHLGTLDGGREPSFVP